MARNDDRETEQVVSVEIMFRATLVHPSPGFEALNDFLAIRFGFGHGLRAGDWYAH